MSYSTYWTISETPSKIITSDFIALGTGLTCLIISLLIFKFRQRIKYDNKIILAWSLILCSVLSLSVYFYFTFNESVFRQDPIEFLWKANSLAIVEGTITDYQTTEENTRAGLRTIDNFKVNELNFSCNDYPFGKFNSFSQTKRAGGILENGLIVRITYIKKNNRMVKIEVES